MVTIKDVAKQAGVSVSTVSYVLSGDDRISPVTKKKVLDMANLLNYAGKSGKKAENKEKIVAAYFHSIDGKFYASLLDALQKVFSAHGYELFVHLGEQIAPHNWIRGMIFLNSQISDEKIEELAKSGTPIVLMDRELPGKNIQNIIIDNFDGQYTITKKVLKMGAKKIVYVGGMASSYDSSMRYEGYRQALLEEQMPLSDMFFVRGDFTYKSGAEAAGFILNTKGIPDAFICANDEMAMGVVDFLKSQNIAVPDSVIVSGFDGFLLESADDYNCLTAYAEHHSWGNTAAYSLIELMDHDLKNPEKLVLPVRVNDIKTCSLNLNAI